MRGRTCTVALIFMAAACGGQAEAPPAATPPVVSAPAEVSSLSFVVVPAGPATQTARAAAEALRSALMSAGYNVVTARRGERDVEIVTHVSTTEERSLFKVSVNGKTDLNERVHLVGSVTSKGRVLDEISADFAATNSQVNPRDVAPAVAALASSQKVAGYARELQAKTENENAKTQRVEEETAWNNARVTGCRQPSSLTGCDGVRIYLAKYPSGAHAAEAKDALTASEPQMERIQKDENTWKSAGAEACRKDHTHDACTGVELYLAKFPAGVHLDEAQALVRGLP